MIIKNIGHQVNYRKVLALWEIFKSSDGDKITDKERACLYLCSLSNALTEYLCENYDFDFINDRNYYTDDTELLLRISDFILNNSKNKILLQEVISSEQGPYILQAINIAFPVLRTGHVNSRNAGRKSIYSDEVLEAIVKDRENGMSYNELSKKYNVPKTTIQFHCKNSKFAK